MSGMIHDVRFGEAEFAVIAQSPLIVLAYRFGDLDPLERRTLLLAFPARSLAHHPRVAKPLPRPGPCSGSAWSVQTTGSSARSEA